MCVCTVCKCVSVTLTASTSVQVVRVRLSILHGIPWLKLFMGLLTSTVIPRRFVMSEEIPVEPNAVSSMWV